MAGCSKQQLIDNNIMETMSKLIHTNEHCCVSWSIWVPDAHVFFLDAPADFCRCVIRRISVRLVLTCTVHVQWLLKTRKAVLIRKVSGCFLLCHRHGTQLCSVKNTRTVRLWIRTDFYFHQNTVEPRLSGLVGTSVNSPDNRESG